MDYQRIAPLIRHLWSPVAAVTSRDKDQVNVQIAVSIGAASIVPDQPRVIVQIYKDNYSWGMIQSSRAFALNFLRPDQLQLLKSFGFVSGRDEEKLSNVDYKIGASGSPILQDCWGYLDCRVLNAMDAGDMTCFLGEVLDGEVFSESEPLWWPQARRMIPDDWNAQWDQKIGGQIETSKLKMGQIDYSAWRPAGGTDSAGPSSRAGPTHNE
ncbi:MAG: flavin reductase [Chloroflexi bacterium]|nr:flavin reductase [Chloroflexota bacterium]